MKLMAKPQYITGKCGADWVEMGVEVPKLTLLLSAPRTFPQNPEHTKHS